jgi:hypothetical protein
MVVADKEKRMAKPICFVCSALTLVVCECMASTATFNIAADASGTSAFSNAAAWNPAVSPSSAEGASYDYVVNNNGEIRMPTLDSSFGGNSLSLGDVGGGAGRMAVQGYGKTTSFSDLILANGHFHNPRMTVTTIGGKITVVSPSDAPFGVYCNTVGSAFSFAAAIETETSATAETVQANFYCLNTNSSFTFSGSLANYLGTMNFYVTDPATQTLPVRLETAQMPGRIIVGNAVQLVLAATGDTTIGSVEFCAGSELVLQGAPGDNTLVATSGIVFPESGTVKLSFGSNALPIEMGDGRTNRLVTVRGRLDSFAAERFSLPQELAASGVPPYELTVIEEAGAKTLVLRTFKTLRLDKNDALSHSAAFLAADSTNWLVSAGVHLEQGIEANPEWVYLVKNGREARTPSENKFGGYGKSDYTFGGRALILTDGMLAHKYVYAVEVPNLVLGPTGKIAASSGGRQPGQSNSTNEFATGGTQRLNGHIHAVPSVVSTSAAQFRSQDKRCLWIDSEIDGTLDIDIVNTKDGDTAYFELSGLNTNYTGRFTLKFINPSPSESTVGVLRFRDARSLGGSPASFTFDAVALRDNAVLWNIGSGSSCVAENRGLYVCGANTLTVDDGATLTFAASVTLDGVLSKNGSGRLVLSDAARFGATAEGVPEPSANVIHMDEGVLVLAHAEALNGVAVTFAEGTSLEIPYSPDPDSDITRLGAALVREGSAVSITGGVLPVSVTGVPADIDLHKFRTAIATFATRQEAESFAAGILVSSQVGDKKRVADLFVSGDETNGFAVLANFSPFGLLIVVR